jgi:hypothetical protein
MKIKQKIMTLVMIMGFALVGSAASTTLAGAQEEPSCGGVETAIITCPQGGGESAQDSGAWGILLLALNIMTAGIGILAVGGIVYGAILYASSEENASQVQKAKDIIKNVVIGLAAYGAMYLFLNFLIPGGIFN